MCKRFVIVSLSERVVMYKEWDSGITFNQWNYLNFVEERFPNATTKSNKFGNKLIDHNKDRLKKSKLSNLTYVEIVYKIFNIPGGSLNINTMKHIFNITR